ncbi:conserved Plasmodium protein, unknown function [Plasmodium gallinaceum]|uniref:PH domain-containing protein n=1 Tax=Plasmodium gallinaceum TaxID=5849 RepID=A0A1J1GVK7_PLAGA|nr:conserved Plasmodium protein, unknown function [Plasmodium gallinaceum]CRG96586.1 conserved Plasmodium protein, unknown function [Plasmodium gallinaceum]
MNSIKLFFCVCLVKVCLSRCNSIFFNKNVDKWTKELLKMPTNEYNNLNELNELTDRKFCGKSLKHLAGLILDKSDKEAKLIIEGSIISNKLILKMGNIKEKEININEIILPIETLSNKCINIRQMKEVDSTILCLGNKVLRNFWINSITDAVLCKMTKINGKLPEFNYEEEKEENNEEINEKKNNEKEESNEEESNDEESNEEKNKSKNKKEIDEAKKKIINEEFDEEDENEEKGLKLRIAKSKFGYPQVKINGKNIEDIKKKESLKKIPKSQNELKNLQNEKYEENLDNDTDIDETE